MKDFWSEIIIKAVLRLKKKRSDESFSRYELAKGYRELKIHTLSFLKDFLFIILGIASAAFGLKSFLIPNKFIDGGVTGISLLITDLSGIPLYVFLILINIPFVVIAFNLI